MSGRYVIPLKKVKADSHAGSKGERLRMLQRWGYRVPRTLVITSDAYEEHVSGDGSTIDRVMAELRNHLGQETSTFAVRSSANIEDTRESSFAGQFKTVLNVRHTSDMADAIRSIWDSTSSPPVLSHLRTLNLASGDLRMAVLVQEMVPSEVSGVSFGRNPINGLDEVIVEAVEGYGDRLVQDGVTPLRWVNKWGSWRSLPDKSTIDRGLIEQVVNETRAIQKKFGAPVDLEWTFGQIHLTWLQLREITSLRDVPVYSNKISKEFLPGMIKPLVWSVNVPLVNGAWIRFMTEAVGDLGLDPNTMAKSFRYRAYFSMSAMGKFFDRLGLPGEMLEVLQGIESVGSDKPRFRVTPELLALMPRFTLFAVDKAFFRRRIERALSELKEAYAEFLRKDIAGMSEKDILASYEELWKLNSEAAYYNIVTPLLLYVYNRMLKSCASKHGLDLEAFDVAADVDELSQYDPTNDLRRLGEEFATLAPESRAITTDFGKNEEAVPEDIKRFREQVTGFLLKFGHLSDSGNDFSVPSWRENPALVLGMLPSFASGREDTRKRPPVEILKVARKSAVFNFAHRMTITYRVSKEQVGSLYTYGYGLFRTVFLELGERLVARRLLDSPEDIFYLSLEEVKRCVASDNDVSEYRSIVGAIKRDMEASRDAVLPSVIFGNQAPPPQGMTGHELRGVPTSRGYYSGPAKTIRSIGEFSKLEKGDVLIIPYSDVGMTPLFSQAGAVVSESGGILSHSSIIAREYGIPAVVSVPGACSIPDNTRVCVDGFEGTVTVGTTE